MGFNGEFEVSEGKRDILDWSKMGCFLSSLIRQLITRDALMARDPSKSDGFWGVGKEGEKAGCNWMKRVLSIWRELDME